MPPSDRPYRVTFVCSGNICRSPMAEVVLRHRAAGAGLADALDVDSAGTGDWHVGEQADARAVATLAAAGYDASRHRARQFDRSDFAGTDLVVALDRGHERTLRAWAPDARARDAVRLLRSFDPHADGVDVADPYYGADDGFAEVLTQVEAAVPGLLDHVRRALDG